MHDMDDDSRRKVLGEALMDELKAIREYVEDIPSMKQNVQEIKSDVDELKSDMKVVKSVVTEHSGQLKDQKKKIGVLKRKTA
ncbi:MAG: hypothetical protein U5L95_03600 [Candidatus Saccharibacteria bacterium]|nr:hypothetical protein [Candidatus Saccharibacteria bacterium]